MTARLGETGDTSEEIFHDVVGVPPVTVGQQECRPPPLSDSLQHGRQPLVSPHKLLNVVDAGLLQL